MPNWIVIKDNIKVCGVYFGAQAQPINEDSLIEKVAKAISFHQSRTLTMRGKAILMNVIALARVWYVGEVACLSNDFYINLNKLLFKFLWNTSYTYTTLKPGL